MIAKLARCFDIVQDRLALPVGVDVEDDEACCVLLVVGSPAPTLVVVVANA